MCFGDYELPSFRFKTLKGSIQVTNDHLFIRDLRISTKNNVLWKNPSFWGFMELIDLENW